MKICFDQNPVGVCYKPLYEWLGSCPIGVYIVKYLHGPDDGSDDDLLVIYTHKGTKKGVVLFNTGQLKPASETVFKCRVQPVFIDEIHVRSDPTRKAETNNG